MRLRGKKAEGRAYENKVGKYLRREVAAARLRCPELFPRGEASDKVLYEGQWLRFEDANGTGYAQPDFFLFTGSQVVVFECKLTRHPHAQQQLQWLYWPLLSHLFGRPCVGVEVFQNPGPGYEPHPSAPKNLLDAIALPDWSIAEWHLLI